MKTKKSKRPNYGRLARKLNAEARKIERRLLKRKRPLQGSHPIIAGRRQSKRK